MKRLVLPPLLALVVLYSLFPAMYAFTSKMALLRISQYRSFASTRRRLAVSSSNVVHRLELNDNFNRWRFMQNFLDGEVEASDANQVIYAVLCSFLECPPDTTVSETTSPLDTQNVRQVIEDLLDNHAQKGSLAAFVDPDCRPGDANVLQKLELLLPDPRENEDAFKGSWDTVIELHGREGVKIQESKQTSEWKAICMVARVLIYFDFMTRGIPPIVAS